MPHTPPQLQTRLLVNLPANAALVRLLPLIYFGRRGGKGEFGSSGKPRISTDQACLKTSHIVSDKPGYFRIMKKIFFVRASYFQDAFPSFSLAVTWKACRVVRPENTYVLWTRHVSFADKSEQVAAGRERW